MPSTEVRWEITYESLTAIEDSHAWKNWTAYDTYGVTTLYVYGPDRNLEKDSPQAAGESSRPQLSTALPSAEGSQSPTVGGVLVEVVGTPAWDSPVTRLPGPTVQTPTRADTGKSRASSIEYPRLCR